MRQLDTDMLTRIENLESRLDSVTTGSYEVTEESPGDRYVETETIHLPWLKAGETVWMELDNGTRLRLYASDNFQISEIGIEEPKE